MRMENPVPLRVLVVDDEDIQRLAISRAIKRLGHQVAVAASGQEALDWLAGNEIDLVVSDWVMEGIDGLELCHRLRSDTSRPYIYFCLMSSRDSRDDLLQGLAAGADDFLRKPLDYEELVVRMRGGQRVLELQNSLKEKAAELSRALAQILADVDAAAEIQRQLLPETALQSKRTDFAWTFMPSARVSGDAINCFRLDPEHIGFYIIDVAGHGVASAMVTMLIAQSVDPRSTSNVLFQRSDQGESRLAAPDRVVSMLNRRMIELNLELVYFTCCYGILDESSGELEFVRAGHTLPLLATSSGAVTVLDDEGDAPVGLFPDVEYHAIRRRLEVGDRLVLYTDGITECTDRDGGEYGVDRLAETLRANAGTRLSDLPASLASSARAWSGKEELADDMTLLVVELSQSAGENPAKPEGDAS